MLSKYRTHVFDLDGVILASNKSKSDAFYATALKYGEEQAQRMVAYHQQAGSLSRLGRWQYFFKHILGREPEAGELDSVMATCSRLVLQGLETAEKVPGVREYLLALPSLKMIVSGVEHKELQFITQNQGVDTYVTYIFGGLPGMLKSERLTDLVLTGLITPPAVYYGDALDDYLAANAAQLDFVFVSGYTEWPDWQTFFADKPKVKIIKDFTEIGVEGRLDAVAS